MSLYQNFSGDVNFVVAGGSLRDKSNASDACSVVNSSSYNLTTIPANATVLAAYLYWCGDYSTVSGSNLTTPDYNVRLDGNPVTASRTFTLSFTYNSDVLPYFSGFADVTNYVSSKKNGTYTFDSLKTNTGSPHCGIEGVVAGWALLVVYQAPGETKHAVNIYDGFDYFLNSSVTFRPGNFYVPYNGKNGKLVHFTWEGDSTISSAQEYLSFDGTNLYDAINPNGNQFNSRSSALGNATTYGVDVDGYDISSYIHSGDTSAISVYSTGGDLVLLSMETISISDTNTADVAVVKTHSPAGASIVAGTAETFSLAVTNSGPDNAGIITVTDSIPTGIRVQSFNAPNWNIDSSAKPKYVFTRSGLNPPGTNIDTIKINTIITHEAYPTSPISNTAAVTTSSPGDRRPWNNTSTDQFSVLTPIFSTSSKTLTDLNGGSSKPKDTLRYTIKAKNTGNYVATNASVVDSVPAGLNIVASSLSPAGSISGQVITFNNVTIAAGDSATYMFRVVIDSSVALGTPVVNRAHIRCLTVNQLVTASFNAVRPLLFLRKTVAPLSGAPGDTLTYTLRYGNLGTDSAKTLNVLDTIPSNTSYVTGSVTGTGASFDGVNRIIVSRAVILAGDTNNTVTFKVRVNKPLAIGTTNVVNKAIESALSAPTVRDSATVPITATSTITVTKSGPSTLLLAGSPLQAAATYKLIYSVTGNAIIDSVYLNDTLPSGMSFKSASNSGTLTGSVVKWNLGTLTPNKIDSVTVIDTTLTAGTYVNHARLTRKGDTTGVLSNNVSTVVGTVNFSTSSKSYQDLNGGSVVSGDSIKYTIKVKNSGTVAATGVVVTDTLPSYVKVKNGTISGSGTLTGSVITWPSLLTLAVGDSATYTATVVLDSTVTNGATVTNTACVNANGNKQVLTASFTAVNTATIFIRKTVDKTTGAPGDTLTYSIKFGNTGTDSARSVVLYDTIPSNAPYVTGSVTGSGAAYDGSNNRILVTRTNPIAQGDTSNVVTFKVKVITPLPVGITNILNKVYGTAANGAIVQSSITSAITASSTVTITKSAPSTAYLVGSPTPNTKLTYTIRYAVTGNGIIDSVYINDTLPSGMSYVSSNKSGTLVGSVVKWSLGTLTPNLSDSVSVTDSTTTAATYVNHARITWKANPVGVLGNNTSTKIYLPHSGTLKQTVAIIPGQAIADTVNDIDLAGIGKIVISLRNTRTSETENDTLTETGVGTGIFVGTLTTVFGTISNGNNNGSFAVQSRDTVAGTYVDSANASAGLSSVTATTRVNGGHTAVINVNPTSFAGGTSLVWTVNDTDMNHIAGVVESYSYSAVSSTGETEQISFTETGVNTGIFTATLATVSGTTPGSNNNGVMTVQPGDTVTVTYRDTLTAIGNSATISAKAIAGSVVLSSSSKTVTDNNGGLVTPRDTMTYLIKAKNTGTAPAASVSLVDSLPTQVTIVPGSITAGGSLSGRVITFASFNLNSGDSLIATYSVTIDTNITDGSVKVNRAHIRANGIDQLVTSSFSSYNRPVMSMVKTVNKSNAKPGDTLTYMVNFTNTGVATADSVAIGETTPLYTTYIHNTVVLNSHTTTDASDGDEVVVIYNTPTIGRGSMTIRVGRVAAGSGGTFQYKVLVN